MQLEARLRAFAALARRGSFSAAAEELVISQPAVSKHVAELEAELGTQLVIRGPRRIRLTPAGEFVADHVERAEALVAQAARGARSLAGAETGRLAIATSGTGMYLAVDAIAAFHAAHSRVELDVQIGTSEPMVELVRAHRAELAIVGGFTAARDVESETLLEDDIVIRRAVAPDPSRPRAAHVDLARGRIVHPRGVRGGVARSRHHAGGTDLAAVVGGGEARGREGRRRQRDKPLRGDDRARGRDAHDREDPRLARATALLVGPRARDTALAAGRALSGDPARRGAEPRDRGIEADAAAWEGRA